MASWPIRVEWVARALSGLSCTCAACCSPSNFQRLVRTYPVPLEWDCETMVVSFSSLLVPFLARLPFCCLLWPGLQPQDCFVIVLPCLLATEIATVLDNARSNGVAQCSTPNQAIPLQQQRCIFSQLACPHLSTMLAKLEENGDGSRPRQYPYRHSSFWRFFLNKYISIFCMPLVNFWSLETHFLFFDNVL